MKLTTLSLTATTGLLCLCTTFFTPATASAAPGRTQISYLGKPRHTIGHDYRRVLKAASRLDERAEDFVDRLHHQRELRDSRLRRLSAQFAREADRLHDRMRAGRIDLRQVRRETERLASAARRVRGLLNHSSPGLRRAWREVERALARVRDTASPWSSGGYHYGAGSTGYDLGASPIWSRPRR